MRIDRIEASKHKRGRVLVFLADGSLLKVTEQELLQAAVSLEAKSEHPLAAAILKRGEEAQIQPEAAEDFAAITGSGLTATVLGAQLLGGRSAPGDVFMEDWLRYWMDELIKPNCEETTCHGYENILNTHMIPSLGRLCVQDLTPVRVQQYYGELRKKGLANNTIRKHHVLLHAALGAAVRQGIVGANVTCLVTPPAREAPQHRFYDSSQLRMLFCASEGTPLEVAVKLAGCLGLRRSEICGLKWRNVDLKRGVLKICEVRTAVSGRALEKAPKSYASERRLAFGGNEDLESLLKRLHRDWERRRKQDPKYNPEGYVAVNEAGKPYQPDVLCQRIAQFIAVQGLPPISLHGLRHSFASVANSQNVPMFSISKALGHSSTSVTSAVYMHLFDDAVADVVSQVASAITGKEQ